MICSGALSSDEVICGHVSIVRAAMAVIPIVEAVQSGFERGDGRGTFCSWGACMLDHGFDELVEDETLIVQLGRLAQLEILSDKLD